MRIGSKLYEDDVELQKELDEQDFSNYLLRDLNGEPSEVVGTWLDVTVMELILSDR